MTELLFGFTVIFAGYVIYEVFKTVSAPQGIPPSVPEPASVPPETIPPPTAEVGAGDPEEKASEHAKPAQDAQRGLRLRNPASGEVSVVPTNYRFAKKWIKEALVAEGLLDKVYKPIELDDAASGKVKAAMDKLKQLDKYQP